MRVDGSSGRDPWVGRGVLGAGRLDSLAGLSGTPRNEAATRPPGSGRGCRLGKDGQLALVEEGGAALAGRVQEHGTDAEVA